jgi:hypothetical protein
LYLSTCRRTIAPENNDDNKEFVPWRKTADNALPSQEIATDNLGDICPNANQWKTTFPVDNRVSGEFRQKFPVFRTGNRQKCFPTTQRDSQGDRFVIFRRKKIAHDD